MKECKFTDVVKKNTFIFIVMIIPPIMLSIASYFAYPMVRKTNMINEIVYFYPRVLLYTKAVALMENLPEEETFKTVMNQERAGYISKHKYLNIDSRPIRLIDGKIVSIYEEKDVEKAEKLFIEKNKNFKITKDCVDELCFITIEKK